MNLYRRIHRPVRVQLEPTTTCNLRCLHCALNDPNYRHETLAWSSFERVMPFLRRYRPSVELSGHGESLACSRFLGMFRRVAGAGCKVSFLSNGMLLREELVDEMLSYAGPHGWHSMGVSVDAATPDLFDTIRRGAKFGTIITNLSYLAQAKRRRNLRHPVVVFNTVAMAMNVHELPEIVRLARSLGAAKVTVVDLLEYDFFRDQKVARDLERARPFLLAARTVADETGVALELTPGIESLLDAAPAVHR